MNLRLTRRSFLAGTVALPAAFLFDDQADAAWTGAATPACGPQTQAQIEGPFFKPRSPLRRNLLPPGTAGRMITLWGVVRDKDCKPIAGALVDLWHADKAGVYDNVGFNFRGHQFTDAHGRYVFDTIMPGLYPGRTRHFHVKVQAAHGPVLTSQLYFPKERLNATDQYYDSALLMKVKTTAAKRTGRFDFVIATK